MVSATGCVAVLVALAAASAARGDYVSQVGTEGEMGTFVGGTELNVMYSCSIGDPAKNLRKKEKESKKSCRESAVSLYSLSLMLDAERSKVDHRPINLNFVVNKFCRECLEEHVTKMKSFLDKRIQVSFHAVEDFPDLVPRLNKPAAAIKVTYPALFPEAQFLASIDADTMFADDVRVLWDEFEKFNDTQMFAMAEEQDALYNRSKTAGGYYTKGMAGDLPFVQPYGINTGVMLFDGHKFRTSTFLDDVDAAIQTHGIAAFRDRKARLPVGDQDVFNVFCHDHMETLHKLPCRWNMRTDSNCKANRGGSNPGILHGSRWTFTHGSRFKVWDDLFHHINIMPFSNAGLEEKMRESIVESRGWLATQPLWP